MDNCLTQIPRNRGKFASIKTNDVYDEAYWSRVADQIKAENDAYEKLEAQLAPRPEDLRKQFAM